jgi:hypothetical protein
MILLQLIGFLICFTGLFLVVAVVLRIFTKWKVPKLMAASLIGSVAITLLLIVVIQIENLILRPVQPNNEEIIGHYEIDRSRYPGKQADWQHATYSLQITQNRAIVRDSRTKTEWAYPIIWYYQPVYRWTFKDDEKRHHMVAEGPDLYRQRSGYYYVFNSPLYGDMFFRKKQAPDP